MKVVVEMWIEKAPTPFAGRVNVKSSRLTPRPNLFDGPITNPEFYHGRKTRALEKMMTLKDEEGIKEIKTRIKIVDEEGIKINDPVFVSLWNWKNDNSIDTESIKDTECIKEKFPYAGSEIIRRLKLLERLKKAAGLGKKDLSNHAIRRFSKNSLQRTLALQLARERKPEKANPPDIAFLKYGWFHDYLKHKSSWYEILRKLKPVYSIRSKGFKKQRIQRQLFIVKTMESVEGSLQNRLRQTTKKVNKKFSRNEPYSETTIKREYYRAKKLLCSKKA